MPPRARAADLTLRETAAALGLSVGTVRQHVKAGRLAATQSVGKYGPEYRLRPAVVAAFGADRYGLELDAADLGKPSAGAAMADDTRELYERLLRATEEATRYRALNAADAEHYAAELARERAARIAAETQLAAELARPFWRRRRQTLPAAEVKPD